MMIENLWNELSDIPTGTSASRLIDAEWPGELEAIVIKPHNLPGLRLKLDEPAPVDYGDLQQSEYVSLEVNAVEGGVNLIQVTLEEQEFRDIFLSLCDDLVARVLATDSQEAGAQTLIRNLGRWLRMMKRRGLGTLSREKQTGLYGELVVLRDVLAPHIGIGSAVHSWTGPGGEFQDFQLNGGLAIETKTLSASRPQSLKISSERQLDDNGFSTLLIAHLAVDLSQGTGQSLPEIIEEIRTTLGDGGLREEFDSRLFETGYLDGHAAVYLQHGYTDRSRAWYHVTPGFPRIIESDLRPGLGRVSYVVDGSACSSFEVDEQTILTWLREPLAPQTIVGSDESQVLEFKSTVWKSIDDDNVPKEVISSIIVKAVLGFLNASGGTLCIGVHDRAEPNDDIYGIEHDCEYLKIDKDRYETRLQELLRVNIGGAAVSNVRLEFRPHRDKTICMLHVRASSRPVLGTLPGKAKKGEHFFVRQGGSTVELTGSNAFDYMRAHFG